MDVPSIDGKVPSSTATTVPGTKMPAGWQIYRSRWLSSLGYRTLDRMEMVSKDDPSIEYEDQLHAYIRFRNEMLVIL
jgi:hypothetical protein